MNQRGDPRARRRIAVIGGGVSGLSAAWLLSRHHDVSLFEKDRRLGGHAQTRSAPDALGARPVDTGFVVFNEQNYPNFTALLTHLSVASQCSDMSFGVSIDGGALEYASSGIGALFAQKRNLVNMRFWSMLADIVRFYRTAPHALTDMDPDICLGDYLAGAKYCDAFRLDHLLPQACAIWSAPAACLEQFPAAAFLKFYHNHGLLRFRQRPPWRTICGGSQAYIQALVAQFSGRSLIATPVTGIERSPDGPRIRTATGKIEQFDDVVLAVHAPQALAMLNAPSALEQSLLGAIAYAPNTAWLHSDRTLMPKRRSAWASWNYIGRRGDAEVTVTYWMNRLQGIRGDDLFVTLNPQRPPRPHTIIAHDSYEHPFFTASGLRAQSQFERLQGCGGVWYCGAYFGAGFHEDGLVSGLAVAERIGPALRPWARAGQRLADAQSGAQFSAQSRPQSGAFGAGVSAAA